MFPTLWPRCPFTFVSTCTNVTGLRTSFGFYHRHSQFGNSSLSNKNTGTALNYIATVTHNGAQHELCTGSRCRKMSSLNYGISFRRAVLADKEAVLSLGKSIAYGDYLYGIFSDVLEDEDSYPIVAVENNEVVGFCMTTLLDGGITIMQRTGRVAESHRKRGLFRMMREELTRHTAQQRPDLQYEAFVTSEKTDYLLDHFRGNGFKPIYRKGVVLKSLEKARFCASKNDRLLDAQAEPPPLAFPDTPEVREMKQQDLSFLFRAETSTPRLFSQQRVFNYLLSYRLLDVNIPALLCEGGGAFYSMDTGVQNVHKNWNLTQKATPFPQNISADGQHTQPDNGSAIDIPKQALNQDGTHRVVMVTFYRYVPTSIGYLYLIDVYSAPQWSTSRDHFTKHLQRHLMTAQHQFPDKNGVLAVTFDLNVTKDMILSCLDETGIRETIHTSEYSVLYEKILRNQ